MRISIQMLVIVFAFGAINAGCGAKQTDETKKPVPSFKLNSMINNQGFTSTTTTAQTNQPEQGSQIILPPDTNVRPEPPSELRLLRFPAPLQAMVTLVDNSDNEAGFWVEFSFDENFENFRTYLFPPNSTTLHFGGLINGKNYFRVRAWNAVGQSKPSNVIMVDPTNAQITASCIYKTFLFENTDNIVSSPDNFISSANANSGCLSSAHEANAELCRRNDYVGHILYHTRTDSSSNINGPVSCRIYGSPKTLTSGSSCRFQVSLSGFTGGVVSSTNAGSEIRTQNFADCERITKRATSLFCQTFKGRPNTYTYRFSFGGSIIVRTNDCSTIENEF